MKEQLQRTFERHSAAFRATYGVETPVAIVTDVLILVVGLASWLLVPGLLKWVGLLVAVGSAIGLLVRVYRAVTA